MAWVLVVDDDEAIRDTLRIMLEDVGYAVAEAPDGQAALEMLRSTPYHAIVLFDLMMPVLDGRGFLEEVAVDQHLAARHGYILLTAQREIEPLMPQALLSQVRVHVVYKPFNVTPLLALIANTEQSLPDAP